MPGSQVIPESTLTEPPALTTVCSIVAILTSRCAQGVSGYACFDSDFGGVTESGDLLISQTWLIASSPTLSGVCWPSFRAVARLRSFCEMRCLTVFTSSPFAVSNVRKNFKFSYAKGFLKCDEGPYGVPFVAGRTRPPGASNDLWGFRKMISGPPLQTEHFSQTLFLMPLRRCTPRYAVRLGVGFSTGRARHLHPCTGGVGGAHQPSSSATKSQRKCRTFIPRDSAVTLQTASQVHHGHHDERATVVKWAYRKLAQNGVQGDPSREVPLTSTGRETPDAPLWLRGSGGRLHSAGWRRFVQTATAALRAVYALL
jgi:hypothetical protein